jgi:hypothetical protein
MEWIIVDDGTDPIKDLIDKSGIEQIKYFREEKKMALGEKRNYMHSKVKGTIIVYMDDDDYYPPERVTHAVDTLTQNREALCVGASEIYVYFKHIHKMYQSGPYSPTHATAGTFAFRVELLKDSSYENHAALAEEKHFLKNYTVPFAQLDPLKTILVFSHEHNTFDKRKLLDNPHPDFFRESPKTVDMFIRQKKEESIKQFFMHDIDALLKDYKPGEPSMKPDVLKQIKQIDEERKKMMEEQQAAGGAQQLMINEPGKPPRPVQQNEIVGILNQHLEEIKRLSYENEMLKNMLNQMQQNLQNNGQTESIFEKPMPETNVSQNSQFTDSLLDRIRELEKELKTIKPIQPSEPMGVDSMGVDSMGVDSTRVDSTRVVPPVISKSKSKSDPEVIVNL